MFALPWSWPQATCQTSSSSRRQVPSHGALNQKTSTRVARGRMVSPEAGSGPRGKSSRLSCPHTRNQSSTARQGRWASVPASRHPRSCTSSRVWTAARKPPWCSQCRVVDQPAAASSTSRTVVAHTGNPAHPGSCGTGPLEAARTAAAAAAVAGGSRATAPLRRARRRRPWGRKAAASRGRHQPCSTARRCCWRLCSGDASAPKKASRVAARPCLLPEPPTGAPSSRRWPWTRLGAAVQEQRGRGRVAFLRRCHERRPTFAGLGRGAAVQQQRGGGLSHCP